MQLNIIIIILMSLLLFCLYFVEPMLTKGSIKDNSEYGTAKFASKSEIKKNYKKFKIKNLKNAGFPIYFSKLKKYVWFDFNTPHWIYIGSTGSGKTVTFVLTECTLFANSKEKKSLFITDPKGEIFEKTSKMFEKKGYKIFTIDFRNPSLSNHLNILNNIINEYELYIDNKKNSEKELDNYKKLLLNNESIIHLSKCDQLIGTLSSTIMDDPTSKEKFWNNSASDLLCGLIFTFLEEYENGNLKRNQITLSSIKKFQSSTMVESNSKFFKQFIFNKKYGMKSKEKLQSLLNISDTTYRSIISTFNERMRIFDDLNIINITSNSDFEYDILGREPVVLYFCIPDETKIYYSLVSIMVSQIYESLVLLSNKQNNKRLPVEIVFMLDEFANTPPLQDISAMVSVARSRGIWFRFFIQSFSQLNDVYGKEISQVIQDNCGLVYLKTNSQETAEAISNRLGTHGVKTSSFNSSLSIFNSNSSQNISFISRNLLNADEVKKLKYKTIIFSMFGNPVYRKTFLYNKLSCYKSGFIEREIRPLEMLVDTYYTVEDMIKNEKCRKDEENENKKNISEDVKQKFDNIITQILKIFVNVDHEIEYIKDNNNEVANLYLSSPMSNSDIISLNELSQKMKFYFSIIISKEKVNKKNRNSKIEIFLNSKED